MRREATYPLGMILAILLGITAAPGPAPAQGSRVFNVALSAEPDFIDPHVSTSVGFVPIDNAYDALVNSDRDSTRLVPVLAESWTASPDGRTWTFKIRRGVKFHDGADLDADAVRASFDRIRKLNKGPVWVLSYLESLTVKDPFTVEMQVRPGGPPFLAGLATIRIVSPKAIKEHDVRGDLAQEFLNRQSAGTGPYRIAGWQRSQKVILTKFGDYWGGWKNPTHFVAANMLIIPEAATQLLMLEKGDIDMAMSIPAEALPELAKNPTVQVVRVPGLRVLYLRLQNAAPPTNDVRVRRAINYAFDAASFQEAMDGTFDPPAGPVPPLFLGDWKPNFPYRYNVARAKELLTAAGYSDARKAKLTADILIDDPAQKKATEILQAGLRATGVADLEIRQNEWPVMLKYNTDWQKAKDPSTAHHVFGLFTPPRVPDAYAYLWYTYDSKAIGAFARNIMNYSNPQVDDLIDRAALQGDRQQRLKLYREATQMIVDDAADLFVGTQQKIYALRKTVQGFYPHPLWYPTVVVYALSR